MKTKDFIGTHVKYDPTGQMIFGVKGNNLQLIIDVRGWGAIQNAFYDRNKDEIDLEKAAQFQDELGEWIADAINQKLKSQNQRTTNNEELKKRIGNILDQNLPAEGIGTEREFQRIALYNEFYLLIQENFVPKDKEQDIKISGRIVGKY